MLSKAFTELGTAQRQLVTIFKNFGLRTLFYFYKAVLYRRNPFTLHKKSEDCLIYKRLGSMIKLREKGTFIEFLDIKQKTR